MPVKCAASILRFPQPSPFQDLKHTLTCPFLCRKQTQAGLKTKQAPNRRGGASGSPLLLPRGLEQQVLDFSGLWTQQKKCSPHAPGSVKHAAMTAEWPVFHLQVLRRGSGLKPHSWGPRRPALRRNSPPRPWPERASAASGAVRGGRGGAGRTHLGGQRRASCCPRKGCSAWRAGCPKRHSPSGQSATTSLSLTHTRRCIYTHTHTQRHAFTHSRVHTHRHTRTHTPT